MPVSRDKILELLNPKYKIIEIEGIKLKILPMNLDLKSRMYIAQRDNDGKELAKIYAETIVTCVVDPDTNQPVFQPNDVDLIKKSSSPILDKILEEIANLSQISDEHIKLAEDELKKMES